jgi:hypothetical protein
MSNTPETNNLARGNHVVPTEFAELLERERDLLRQKIIVMKEWSAALADIGDDLRANRDEAREALNKAIRERDRLAEALQKLADCDWVITPHDRMDAVRTIARDALQSLTPNNERLKTS